ncbi:MAG: hypothetical protein PVJ28_12290 [Acidimicrobiia bacterium]|jgi:hypothetical protein
MVAQRDDRWSAWRDYIGGLVMFAAEAFIVIGLVAVAWVFSVAILAFF